jgi:hypothetical protein
VVRPIKRIIVIREKRKRAFAWIMIDGSNVFGASEGAASMDGLVIEKKKWKE